MGMALDELKENEETNQIDDIELLISDTVQPYTDGNKIDYVKSPGGEGFVIAKAGQTCC